MPGRLTVVATISEILEHGLCSADWQHDSAPPGVVRIDEVEFSDLQATTTLRAGMHVAWNEEEVRVTDSDVARILLRRLASSPKLGE